MNEKHEKLTVDQAGELLPLKVSTIRTFCRQGRIPSIKLGKSYFIDMEVIIGLLDGSIDVGPPPARELDETPAADELPEAGTPDEV